MRQINERPTGKPELIKTKYNFTVMAKQVSTNNSGKKTTSVLKTTQNLSNRIATP